MSADEGSADELTEAGEEELWAAERRSRIMYGVVAALIGIAAVIGIIYGAVSLA